MSKLISFIFVITSLFEVTYGTDQAHEFIGTHFVASYRGCKHEALCNLEKLKEAMQEAIEQSGATVLRYSEYVFPKKAFTIVWLLSESHASIHTYPEYNACFVDLFTCGNGCCSEMFDQIIRAYLDPKDISVKVMQRD